MPNCQAFTPEQSANRSLPFDFSSQTRMSSVDLPDPISIANARLQAPHAAAARSIEQHLIRRSLGIFGEPRVNVLELNLVLKRAFPQVAGDTPACAKFHYKLQQRAAEE